MSVIRQLADLGQSIWLDYIRRSFIDSGELQEWIDRGLRGITSNPSIFEKAIAGSTDYDEDLQALVEEGKSVEQIYETLALDDIRSAVDLLRPVYDQTSGGDGYVSLEVSPKLAHDTQGTIDEARRLFTTLNRPNVMIKVPATPAGIPAISTLIGEGVNVNVTLIFSLAQYEAVAEAYIAGLEKWVAGGGNPARVASVASFFVSRVDSAVDRALEEKAQIELQGKIAIANAKVSYARFQEIFRGDRWERLARKGARVQRVLWASTSTKNPLYPDTLYVDSLIESDTVNTVPPATLNMFLDHGTVALTLETRLGEARADLARLAEVGVDLGAITEKLQDDGVAAFAKSFEALMASIGEKRDRLLAGWEQHSANLGPYQDLVDTALSEMAENNVVARIWAHDHTLWKPEPAEITNRLGWLYISEIMMENTDRLATLVKSVRTDGYTHALLLGMGGSSLAPEVFRKAFGVRDGSLDLAVLDSTDPGAVLGHADRLDLERTLFIVATKSGTTAETLSFFKFFYNQVAQAVGTDRAGEHFIAVTDPGTPLTKLASRYRFRATFVNDPNIGGRYSALSYFGLVPAALIGVDVRALLGRAMGMACGSEPCVRTGQNPGAWLGTVLGVLAKVGRDKVTLLPSSAIAGFGDWVEQLLAESTGKDGRGVLPVVGEPLGLPEVYGDDRLFVRLRLKGDESFDEALASLEAAGHPVVRLNLRDRYDLGAQFFLWELATAVAGFHLRINPFDQPDVEAAKVLARQMVSEYMETGVLPAGDSAPLTAEALGGFLAQAQPGDYISLQAYLRPTAETDAALHKLRALLRDRSRLSTTVGYGPRYLHSTGQLHKGDAGRGLFIQLTDGSGRDVAIPDEAGSPASSITFGVLKASQALGDQRALLNAGRRVIHFHLGEDVHSDLKRLSEMLD